MQLMLALQQLENTREEKEDLEEQLEEVSNLFKSSVEEYQQHIAGLQVALEQARADASEHQTEELARCLQLELEKEKGRLAGVEETHQALKEHTDSLEATLAGRETTIVELDAHAQAVLLSKEQENQTCRQRMKSLQREIDEHRRSIKELRTQLLSEKGGSVRNKRNVESMTMKLDQLGQDLKNKCEEVQLLRVEFDRSRNSEMRYRERCSQLDTEVKALRTDVERLRRQLVDTEAKDPVLVEQMKTLTWHLRQKNIEIDGLREQLKLSEERQGAEIDNVKKNSLVSGKELESIRHELANTREEKFSYQAKMVELQAALKATVEHNEMLKKLQKGEVGEEESILAQPRYSMAAIEELLQQSVASAKSRPLHSLQACLKNLRNEMQQLQQQVSDHTNAIQNTAQSWRHVESQVKVIKEQCTSGLMGTTNSPTTTNSNSQTAVEIV
ncbi:PREDICTED: golgin subfamily A member 3-like [Priapulus caudatus]|uniref:Golgin subfamily A member 3-like n=1 Tax=Priapulus caudatus TaxID=37621 RepID=A0ABM1ERE0_PRICU|nr:PREDICTED: golgin subfamily A member 3-like [Priapulus caudatus]